MEYAVVFLAGIALGCFYFGGLWLTTRSVARVPKGQVQLISSFSPALKMFLSFIGRMGVTLAGMYWLMQGNWIRALMALLGILLARFLVKYWVSSVVRKEVSE
ncbi:F1/F0 ATPase, Methanosarcina type, subunit 2 [Desulfobulbus propionicus DSM 2032]|uniref:F1/F0 ATPase, Methanosarcina type, subunit 2 n=2 Tax=Desulfobulbus propionicus TaxID=894 RepID=A0A7U3YL86_DESPD|nr:F1/F0 ATPase, Methanosarcina type, subunit 2 [Desulfobulbus propionicus DSM 2032]